MGAKTMSKCMGLALGLQLGALCLASGESPVASDVKQQPAVKTAGKSTAVGESQGKVLFRDDFSNPTSGWERNRDEDYVSDYDNGEYQIKNVADRQITRGMHQDRKLTDGDFSVTVRKTSGPDDIRFGLVARYSGDAFLDGSIMPDGRCLLWVAGYANYALAKKPVFKPCASVKRGNQPNRLRLVVSGKRAWFYVNGEKMGEIDDLPLNGAEFGLFANSTSVGSDVHFDDFEVREPPPAKQ